MCQDLDAFAAERFHGVLQLCRCRLTAGLKRHGAHRGGHPIGQLRGHGSDALVHQARRRDAYIGWRVVVALRRVGTDALRIAVASGTGRWEWRSIVVLCGLISRPGRPCVRVTVRP
jgi:hypothetical protein